MSLFFVRADLWDENHDLFVKAESVAMAVELWKRNYVDNVVDRADMKGHKVGVYLLSYHPHDMNTVIDWAKLPYETVEFDGT